ncbi:MAG TPA: hypothetical protein VGQ83_08950 [Polyangia bacterium]
MQGYLRALAYNWEPAGETLRTFRAVVRRGTAHCLEAALAAATILEQHGYPPLLLDLESQDNLDHVLFLFHGPAGWGTVGKSRDAGLHGRRPGFRSVRALVHSYVEPFVDFTGRIVRYGVADLRTLVPRCDWRLSARNVWAVRDALIAMPHTPIPTSDTGYELALRRYRAFRARHPKRQALYFPRRGEWW